MKLFFVFLVSLAALPSIASMTTTEQNEYIADVAKELRRDMWIRGYEDVHSHTEEVTKDFLDDHVRGESMRHYETALDRDEISQLYRCYHRSNCELYFISLSASMWGGYGVSGHFILLYTETRRHFEISHSIYSE